ncbi:FHA domain-containing protein [Roseateles koreensis]|uniref:FHA domain-containing protein n=1 Tax=Roseateles koreensis TaxID=2987526 RepID=A0ABT5KRI1_9BURK|nr:FHA domain-containing protein [Roseateles koreensis]MDC8785533.1 FHA domain-containing protein [Roseateles koreensis]
MDASAMNASMSESMGTSLNGSLSSPVAVIEILGREGQVLHCHRFRKWPVCIGRSARCDLVLDDVHLAPEHAVLDWPSLVLEVPHALGVMPQATLRLLPSLNGGWLSGRRLQAGDTVTLPDEVQFQLGATSLRWRNSAAPLAPEQPLERHQHPSHLPAMAVRPAWVRALLMVLVWLALLGLNQWSSLNPGAKLLDYAGSVLGPLSLLLVWTALSALVSQLFQRRFPFLAHLCVVLPLLIARQALDLAVPLLAYALSWPRLMAATELIDIFGLALMLSLQAALIWPRQRTRRVVAVVLASLCLMVLGLEAARRQEQQYWFGPPYLSALPPPMFRWASPKSPDALIESLRPLEAQLATRAAKDNDQAGGGAGDDGE